MPLHQSRIPKLTDVQRRQTMKIAKQMGLIPLKPGVKMGFCR